MALNMLFHSKLRSWLTIIGIVIGVGAVVGILSLGNALQSQVQNNLATLDLTSISITPGYSRAATFGGGGGGFRGGGEFGGNRGTTTNVQLTKKDIDALRGVVGIQYIAGMVTGRENVTYNNQGSTLAITGVDPKVWQYMNTINLSSGRLFQPSDNFVAIIGSGIAHGIYKKDVGINQIISINNKSFRVVGIIAATGGGDRQLYVPTSAADIIITGAQKDVYDSIQVKASSTDIVNQVAADITSKLMISRHVNNNTQDFTVFTLVSTAATVTSIVSSISLFLGAIAAVSLVVGGVGIANTMFTTVLEKTREIGTMKAIGAKNKDILMIFLVYAAMVGFVGGILGVALGVIVSSLLPSIGIGTSITVSPGLAMFGLGLAVIIGIVSGVIPAYRAAKLKPVDALRYE